MRWDQLFGDLSALMEQEQRDEERALAIEEERLRLARLSLRDRLIAMSRTGDPVRLELVGGAPLALERCSFGKDWLSAELARSGESRQCIVSLDAVAAVLPSRGQLAAGLAPAAEAPTLNERIGLAFVLRDLSRRRLRMRVHTQDGEWHGTIDRVARDHLDLALHDVDLPRRERDVQGYRLVPFARLSYLAFG